MSKGTPFTREIVDRLDDLESDIDTAVTAIEDAATDISGITSDVTDIKAVTDVIPDAGAMTSIAQELTLTTHDSDIKTLIGSPVDTDIATDIANVQSTADDVVTLIGSPTNTDVSGDIAQHDTDIKTAISDTSTAISGRFDTVDSEVTAVTTEVETSTLDVGDGDVGDNVRAGLLLRYVADNLGGGDATLAKENQILDGTVDLSGEYDSATDNLHDIYLKVAAIPTTAMRGTDDAFLAATAGTTADDHEDATLFGWIDKTYDMASAAHDDASTAAGHNNPDAAGTAAGLHATTDGLINDVQSTADDILEDTGTTIPALLGTAADDHEDATIFGLLDKVYDEAAAAHSDADAAHTDAATAAGHNNPDAAGTAAGLHATTDGKIDTAQLSLDDLVAAGICVKGKVSDVAPSTADFDTDLAEATANHYRGQLLLFTSGVLAGQADYIEQYGGVGGNCNFTFASGITRFTEAPADEDDFIILPSNYWKLCYALVGLSSMISDLDSDVAGLNDISTGDVNGEVEDVINTDDLLDHLLAVDDGAQNYPTQAADGSVISLIISKDAGGDSSDYSCTTDSLEALSDKLGGYSGDGGAASDDSVKAATDLIITDVGLTHTHAADTETKVGTVGTGDTSANVSLHEIKHKDANHTFSSTTDSLEAIADTILPGTKFATKTSTSHLTSGDLFTFTGTIGIVSVIGRITTQIEAVSETVKLTCTPDALTATDICATKDINGMAVGTLLSITGTFADALVATTGVGCAVSQASMITATCVTDGHISTVFNPTGSKDGVIVWELLWIPLTPGATCVAA